MPETPPPSEEPKVRPEAPRALVRRSRRWSSVWVVPLVALTLCLWLVWKNYRDAGPVARVSFETADSLVSGKTEVRCRSVRVGMVEHVELAPDLRSVVASLRLDPEAAHLLREGTRFWVVRPRVSASAVSGLSTIISGAYVELDPGSGPGPVYRFTGLEKPPVTPSHVPGLRLTLVADDAGSLTEGAPVYYRGFEVGRVEQRTFSATSRQTRFDIFIAEEYARLVTTGTCFWNTSGVDVSAGSDGFKVRTPSFQAMLAGGVSFAVPPGADPGGPVQDGAEFPLFPNEEATQSTLFRPDRRCLLFFDQSVRGLQKGAPVEFRGLPLGRVVDISFKYQSAEGEGLDPRVPVLIEIDRRLLRVGGKAASDPDDLIRQAVREGLRARLGTGSLLTGALYIDLDYVPNAPPAELTQLGEYDVIPTHSSGLAQLEAKVNALLSKLEQLPVEETLEKLGKTADEFAATAAETRTTLAEAKKILAAEETRQLTTELNTTLRELRRTLTSLGPGGNVQGDLHRTLDELRAALRAFKNLSNTVEDKPNSLLFGKDSSGSDPIPRARRP